MALTQQQAEAALKKETANNAADRMMREIRASVLFQFKWEDLLTSAPVSISCLGACMVAASSPINVTFEKPKEGFKYLVYALLSLVRDEFIDHGTAKLAANMT